MATRPVRSRPPRGGPHRPSRDRLTRTEAQAITRRRLLEAAADVFSARGFHATSLADVADRAGYTIGAVYSNFAGKDELFHALMRERMDALETSLEAVFSPRADDDGTRDATRTREQLIEAELDRMAAAEDGVPPGWWRLLAEFRAYAATDPTVRAELAESEARCRAIIADHIDRFAARAGIELPLPAPQLADLTNALSDGLRAAHAEGRTTLTSGEGLRRVVAALIAGAPRGSSGS